MKNAKTFGVLKIKIWVLSLRRFIFCYSNLIFSTKLYQKFLSNFDFEPQVCFVKDKWKGNTARGRNIAKGDFEFLGKFISNTKEPWQSPGASKNWRAHVSEFSWLRDLHATNTIEARIRGRQLVLQWINTKGKDWHTSTARPEVLAARVSNWLYQSPFLLEEADGEFISAFKLNLMCQIIHLKIVFRILPPGIERIIVLKGLILAFISYENMKEKNRWLKLLNRELEKQILPDGGHISRSPLIQLVLIRNLIEIREALLKLKQKPSNFLQTAIENTVPMLQLFRHGDGGLALFHGSNADEFKNIETIIKASKVQKKPLVSAPNNGFERLSSNGSLILIDVGMPPPIGYDQHTHASALSFEFSSGKERIVTNCGANIDGDLIWQSIQRTTAAHSTVTVEDTNSLQILKAQGIGNRPEIGSVLRRDDKGSIWIETIHHGYKALFSISHKRKIYLAAGGHDFRGEDTIDGGTDQKFTARFHLHPSVQASLVHQSNAVLLRLPSGIGWRFKGTGGVISLPESIYLGVLGEKRRTKQIVISAASQSGFAQLKWEFSCLTG